MSASPRKPGKPKTIAFQGEPGANSHIACKEAYPDCEPVPCPTFEDALNAVAAGEVDLGMIPIENSLAGRVADIHHLMPTAGLHIIGEWFLPIRNQLMAPSGATLKSIKFVESHIMALGQCRNFVRKLGVKTIVAADTAGAARDCLATGGRDLWPRNPCGGHRRRSAFDNPFRRSFARRQSCRPRQRTGDNNVCVPGAQHPGGALQGAWRICHQWREYDQARKLYDRRQFFRHAVLFGR